MKRTILLLALFISIFSVSYAQSKEAQKDIDKFIFFGVDYSNAKAYDVPENSWQLKQAFLDINDLFYSEPKKYNLDKIFNKTAIRISNDGVKSRIDQMDEENIKTSDNSYTLDEATIAKMIKTLPIEETEGVGLIAICEKINKKQNRGYYHIAYFDIATRDIIDSWKADGKAAGFGLRNFWATSALKAMKAKRPK